MYYEKHEKKEKSPFDIDLRCNINIETHVAMRLGELILASGTEDKQILALGHRLSNSMVHLVDQLDNKQWDRLYSFMEEQSKPDSEDEEYSDHSYSSKAKNVVNDMDAIMKNPERMQDFVKAIAERVSSSER
jgi:uncharacterized UPF0160 family protein